MSERTSATRERAITSEPATASQPSRRGLATNRWLVVTFLMLVAVLNLADRFLPAVLAEPIKHELELSDTALGLINGTGFLILYALAGVPIARLSDRGLYGMVIGVCVGVWSAMTFLGGLAQTGWQPAATRMGVALGEAGSLPAAHAYISRNFPPDRRAAPLAVLTLYVPFGTTLALLGGGFLGERLGWRGAFMVMGVIGLVMTPLALLLVKNSRTPKSGSDLSPAAPRAPILPYLRKPSLIAILAASSLIGVAGYSTTFFAPAFLMRSHGLSVSEVGLRYGLVSGAFGVISLLLVGAVADRMSSKNPRWLLGVVVAMIACIAPISIASFVVPSAWAAIFGVAMGNIIQTAYLAPVIAATHRLVPPEARATASAILLCSSAIVGSLGPMIAGMLSDALAPKLGNLSLGRALLIVIPSAQVLAGAFYLLATLRFHKELVSEMPGGT
jgi:MFS family permease